MKEFEYLKIIQKTLSDSSMIGDDCAFLEEFGLCVTQDTLCEGVHFLLSTTDAYSLGQKAVNVNFSDLAAAGAKPLYLTISLSLPKSLDESFVKAFYEGVNDACLKYGAVVAGGDLTGSESVFVSICAIGKKINDVKVSRSFAKEGDVVVVTGFHGDSAGGLRLLQNGIREPQELIKKHLLPAAQCEKSTILMEELNKNGVDRVAMMDSSDGLGDALFKLSQGCGFAFDLEFDLVPVNPFLKLAFPQEWKDLVLWGGEDFELVFCTSENVFEGLDKSNFFKIGKVSGRPCSQEDEIFKDFSKKSFDHFKNLCGDDL